MAMRTENPFFRLEDDWYLGNDGARGPWTADGCHGGPAAAAVARSAELAVPDKQIVRLTLDLFRPVPVSGFRVQAQVGRNGRRVATVALTVLDRSDRACATASALFIATSDIGPVATSSWVTPNRQTACPTDFPRVRRGHGLPTFADAVELMIPEPGLFKPGPNTMWMRTPPLIAGETPSAFQSICPLADCGNSFSRNEEATSVTFINPDLSITMHRPPASEWIGASFVSRWERNSVGLSTAVLFDDEGPLGSSQQSLLLQRPDTEP